MISEVFNMDCMEGMKQYPDKYFELAIVDPPYGINMASRGNVGSERGFNKSGTKTYSIQRYKKSEWDNSPPDKIYFYELIRISKHQIIWGANHFISKIPFDSPCWIVWDKDKSGNYADCELAYTSFTSAVKMFEWRWNGMLQEDMKNKEERFHPTQKPVALYKWLLKNYAKEGDKILDTHGGSMSSVIACLDMGFQITCYELDKDYYNSAKIRIENYLSQENLFKERPKIVF